MIKSLLKLIVLLIAFVVLVKFVPPVQDLAREYLPGQVLDLIGESPKGIMEKGLDRVVDKIK
ncbi:MAG: hypothetical protein GY866_33835 [Proteobacteria bacterium]|nr:hypothetical protein [Pseudomonadota bacterium]